MFDLFNEDCLETMRGMPDGLIDLVLTDPPYGTTACKWDSVIPFEPMWKQLKRITKPKHAIVLFGSEPFSSALRMSNIKDYKYDWVWNKKKGGNPLIAKIQPIKVHENVIVFNCVKKYYPVMEKRDREKWSGNVKNGGIRIAGFNGSINKKYTHKYPKSILEISNANQNNRVHPTQKPVALMEYLIKTYSREEDVVLDFTMGSGTMGVAALNLNRHFIGIEKDSKYFEIAKRRIEEVASGT